MGRVKGQNIALFPTGRVQLEEGSSNAGTVDSSLSFSPRGNDLKCAAVLCTLARLAVSTRETVTWPRPCCPAPPPPPLPPPPAAVTTDVEPRRPTSLTVQIS